eukprot:CAMPEP_0174379552 /NCGR_PEP_ID=MMETSP0811_2-20130205/122787_1 /TAXON_ID=73025 ORGANISM="Eutreptiella gymnastica-like, Strain CCMP1594" /NCGR_SAMPLE_ID=MMETSP0811_2 /ASSEMBLY_ACC=CAM_ASM_000667 /LENGTH=72 /DNA_ID=CAMNT_0015532127 /DNA_START=209 /DNA_END=427 /DNA_ORIENTATION=+
MKTPFRAKKNVGKSAVEPGRGSGARRFLGRVAGGHTIALSTCALWGAAIQRSAKHSAGGQPPSVPTALSAIT